MENLPLAWWHDAQDASAPQQETHRPTLSDLRGRLCEFSSQVVQGVGSLAARYVWDAQKEARWPVWISCAGLPFAEDLQANGIDLQALVVIRTDNLGECLMAAEQVMRSGVCGAVVVDVGEAYAAPMPIMARLLQHARRTDTACVFLTTGEPRMASLSALISYRVTLCFRDSQVQEAMHRGPSPDVEIDATVVRDKKSGRSHSFETRYRAIPGLYGLSVEENDFSNTRNTRSSRLGSPARGLP